MNAVLRRLSLKLAIVMMAGVAVAAGAALVEVTARITVSVRLKVEPKPTVTAIAIDPNAAEYPGNWGQVRITRTGDLGTSLTVHFTIGGTATNGVDYDSIPSMVTMLAGVNQVVVTIKPKNDSVKENTETVTLTLAANAAYTIGSPGTGTVSIANRNAADHLFWPLYE